MSDALAAVEAIVGRGGDADDVLRAVVAALVDDGACAWAGIAFVEDRALVLGPHAGASDEARRERVPILYRDERVGELWADAPSDRGELERVAPRLSEHVLLGWDTGGERWEP